MTAKKCYYTFYGAWMFVLAVTCWFVPRAFPAVVQDTIFIASEPNYPPYCMIDDSGNARGFSIDLFNAVAEAIGMQVYIKIGIWSKIKQDLADGKIDALPLVGKTKERENYFDFSMPYMSLHGAVFVREGDTRIKSLDDLKDKEILVMSGDNAEEFVRRAGLSDKIFTTNTFEEAFKQLDDGEHDAVITQRVMGIKLLDELGIESVKPLGFYLPEFRQDFCFAVQKGDTVLLARLNEGLSIIMANKTFNAIREKWFASILNPEISFYEIFRLAMFILTPLLIVMGLVAIFFLRKEVNRQTKDLQKEVAEHKITLNALRALKGDLEETVKNRTMQLQEKVEKLDKSEKALLFMVEDLNQLTVELKEEKQKLSLSNNELEAFTYSVSHDLRAPLRAIDGFGKFLLEDYADKLDAEGVRFIRVIRQNSVRMDRLISDLLNLSRVSRYEIKLAEVDMGKIIAETYDIVATSEEKETFEITINPMPLVVCDVVMIRQVWQNLIDNALKYSAKSVTKKIEIEAKEKGKGDEREIVFSIRDHGAGFDEKYGDKLFGVFQRLHSVNEFTGTGVGLAIVMRIVCRHGGNAWATGKINTGATVYFSLPRKIKT